MNLPSFFDKHASQIPTDNQLLLKTCQLECTRLYLQLKTTVHLIAMFELQHLKTLAGFRLQIICLFKNLPALIKIEQICFSIIDFR